MASSAPSSSTAGPAEESLTDSMKAVIYKFVSEMLPKTMVSAVNEEMLGKGVAKLYDGGEAVGSFTFLGENVGTTCFHAVYLSKQKRIQEASLYLKIGGRIVNLKHVVSVPYFDVSIYQFEGTKAPMFFEIDLESLHTGDSVILIGFPDLGESDCNPDFPVFSHGKVSQTKSSAFNSFFLADYQCHPNDSGGAIVSAQSGKLVGIHISSNYHVDKSYKAPFNSKLPDYPYECGAVYSLSWQPPGEVVDLEASSDGSSSSDESSTSEGADSQIEVEISMAFEAFGVSLENTKESAFYSAANSSHKGHHGCFLPAAYLKSVPLFSPECRDCLGVKNSVSNKDSRRRHRKCRDDGEWRKMQKVLGKFRNNAKGY